MVIGSTAYALKHANRHRHNRRCLRQHLRDATRSINYRNLFLRFIGGHTRWQ